MRKAALLGVQSGAAARCWVSLTPSSASRSIFGVLSKAHMCHSQERARASSRRRPCGRRWDGLGHTSKPSPGFRITWVWVPCRGREPPVQQCGSEPEKDGISRALVWFEAPTSTKGQNTWVFFSVCPGVRHQGRGRAVGSKLSAVRHQKLDWDTPLQSRNPDGQLSS